MIVAFFYHPFTQLCRHLLRIAEIHTSRGNLFTSYWIRGLTPRCPEVYSISLNLCSL